MGARQDIAMRSALGFSHGAHVLSIDAATPLSPDRWARLAATLTACFRPSAISATTDPASQGIATDGKAQRGRLRFAHTGCPAHALSAFCHDSGVMLAHEPIEAGLDNAEAELTVAPVLLAGITWPGRVPTGDALLCQRALCEQVLAAGGDSLLLVKANQETLYRDIGLLFDPPTRIRALPLIDQRVARTVESGYGRSLEMRELIASTGLTSSLDWPGVQQVFRLERTWREHGSAKCVLHYGITSLTPQAAAP